ncbi:ATP/cobalamin adenosyltransferase [Pseudopedobacter saltans DSM 12145]|uniref:Corrinoid adenosyltransferase n=1 Tax=Pseudopedobacter saltans (strain ATCC 51119 / DSM 12145 / JCM 21818 / CCUG 39354 / LMG 10337 / NBRC 100064 / NCIMB 13643) TaxID=762903 RepID=F0S7Y1_PSESL|nr:cob(I)yrinic acid a,c-diamide adenosyltransferase [Pseudopedobacter saltans]ADY51202.1 ATP/cobalamin adenosyltransferase [Pseudopedobacter saltans DSM 12145]
MKIYTKTGDKGYTSLIGGTRISKHHLRIESYGTIDELNSYLGLIKDQDIRDRDKEVLKEIQDRLFTIGALLASDPEKQTKKVPDLFISDVELLEKEIDLMTEILPALRHFVLPGGTTASSFCHIARCVCRRAERLVVELSETSIVEKLVIMYLNRLSDYLFVLSRTINHLSHVEENKWIPRL